MLLLQHGTGCSENVGEPEPVTIQTPAGPATAHKTELEAAPQEVRLVTDDGRKKFKILAGQGPELISAYLSEASDSDVKDIDVAFAEWMKRGEKRHSRTQIVEILGALFGEKCVQDFDMEWVRVTNTFGTSFAIRAKGVEVMAFPFDSIEKRIDSGETDFFTPLYYGLKQMLESGEYQRPTDKPDQ